MILTNVSFERMKAKVEKVSELLKSVSERANSSLDHSYMITIAEKINEEIKGEPIITKEYLYKHFVKKAETAIKKGEDVLSFSPIYLNKLSKFAGYESYSHFEQSEHKKIDPQLKSCEGTWYSFVRCNSGKEDLLMSPVRILEENRTMQMILKGPSREFKGELRKKGINLFAFLESEDAKELHLVFKIGIAMKPEVLQGVFSGISSGGDPIAGKEVLIRVNDKTFEELRNERISIKEAEASSNTLMRSLANAFKRYEGNSLKITGGSTFTISDLD